MNTSKSHWILASSLITVGLLGLIWLLASNGQSALADSTPINRALADPITDRELVRNGGFDQYGQYGIPNAWYIYGTGTGVNATAGQDGGPALSMENIMEILAIGLQELYPPTQTTAASLAFDYRLLPSEFSSGGGAYLEVGIMAGDTPETATVITSVLPITWVYADTGWLQANAPLSTSEVTQIQSAHAAGQRVWIVLNMVQSSANQFKALLDNVSFKVSGSMDYPTVSGSIAYVGQNNDGYPITVNSIDPDGSDQQTLWTHPGPIPDTNTIYDVAWKPDATELAFSSNHDQLHSAFHSDVYGIKPDGSDLRRITNPPSKAELEAGGYQTGTVIGKVKNDYGNLNLLFLYIEGALDSISVPALTKDDEVSFTVPDVADLGIGLHYLVFTWADGSNANCKEYQPSAIVDVEPGQTVDAGTLTFNPTTCNKFNTESISWKRDGSQVGFFVTNMPRQVPATGQAFGTELFNIGTVFAEDLAWSPADDQILYRRQTFDANSGFYLTTAGGGIGTLKASDQTNFGITALYATQAWLPDGSGFVYTLDDYMFEYDLASGQVITLATFPNEFVDHPSLSPDGNYIVFERLTTSAPIQRDLWMMNRANPTEMWPLTDDGKSGNPDWSRQNPSTPSCTAIGSVTINGPTTGFTNTTHTFSADITPADASTPITYDWSPAPASGQGTATAMYTWAATGTHTITLTAENCGGQSSDTHTIDIVSTKQRVYLPLVVRN